MTFSPFEVLCIAAAVAVAPLALALLTPTPRRFASNQILLLLLVVNGLLLTRAALLLRGVLVPTESPWLYLGGLVLFVLMPPLVYLYAAHVLRPTRRLDWSATVHALPALAAFAALAALYLLRRSDAYDAFPITHVIYIDYFIVLNVVFLGYAVAAVRLLRSGRASDAAAAMRRRWAVGVSVLFATHWAFSASAGVVSLLGVTGDSVIVLEALSVAALLIFSTVATFLGARRLPSLASLLPPARYAGSALDREEIQRHAARLEAYLHDQRPYLDPSLSAERLADALRLTPRELSQVMSEGLGRSFFDVVNGYRIEEAQRLLRNPERVEATILEVLYEAGFNSKSAFNRAFKHHTGQTPSAYRRTLNEAIPTRPKAA